MADKINKVLDRAHAWIPYTTVFLINLSTRTLLYITAVFAITGVFRFRPDMLMQFFEGQAVNAGIQDITLQEYWQVALPVILAIEMIYSTTRLIYKNAELMEPLLSLVASFLAYIQVAGTHFDGDGMLATYFLWWIIRAISQWSLARAATIHKTENATGTAVCAEKESIPEKPISKRQGE